MDIRLYCYPTSTHDPLAGFYFTYVVHAYIQTVNFTAPHLVIAMPQHLPTTSFPRNRASLPSPSASTERLLRIFSSHDLIDDKLEKIYEFLSMSLLMLTPPPPRRHRLLRVLHHASPSRWSDPRVPTYRFLCKLLWVYSSAWFWFASVVAAGL